MDSLAVVEAGSVDRWLSSVLKDMFYEDPKVRVSRRVVAILYGDSVRDDVTSYMAAWRTSRRHTCMGGMCSGIMLYASLLR